MTMSGDIRTFFNRVSSKKADYNTLLSSPVVKRKSIRVSSDENEISETPKEKSTIKKLKKKKRQIIESDEEDVPVAKQIKKPKLEKLKQISKKNNEFKDRKVVDITQIFSGEPKRVDRKRKNNEATQSKLSEIEADDDFDKSIAEIDENVLGKGLNKIKAEICKTPQKEHQANIDKSFKESPKTPKSNRKLQYEQNSKESPNKLQKTSPISVKKDNKTPSKNFSISNSSITPKVKKSLSEIGSEVTPKLNTVNKTPKIKSSKKQDLDASVISDEERFEKKRLAAALYQKYKNRQSAINPGSKEIPKGAPNCLSGLSFLVTGVLDSLERDDANNLIKELGGKVSTTVGKRLNYLIVGEEAGPKKLATAEELGIKMLSEDDLFNLILEKSNKTTESITTIKNIDSPKVKQRKLSKTPKKSPLKRKIQENSNEQNTNVKKIKIENENIPKVILNSDEKISLSQSNENNQNLAWVDKYKPTSVKQIIGQQGAASCCVKLTNWLSKWYINHDGKKKLQKPNPWAKNDDGSYYKAALLSGPPGVGKTTTVTLVCKELGFDMVEFNASDTRSKKLLKEEVSELLSNQSLYGFFHGGNQAISKKHVLIMDEIDGMAGNEDRGGIQEMISLIKESLVPIICMCNDRNHQKMRSLVNYCYDIKFNKPRLEQIKGAIMSICFKEKLKLPPAKIEEIIKATNNDIRQTLNHLSLLNAGQNLKLEDNRNHVAKKDLRLGPWEVVRKVFSAEEHKKMSLNEKSDLFFNDYSLGPLFVQENYLSVAPKVPKNKILQHMFLAADALSIGDLVDKRIRTNSAWSLLPVQAMYSSVLPGEYMAGNLTKQINFPGWLGKNSKTTKRSRLAQEIHDHTRICTSGSRLSIRLDYAPFLMDAIVRPLKIKGSDGVENTLNIMKEYRLLREDIESLIELNSWPGKKNPMDDIDGKIKAALTRAYNKDVLAYSYSANANLKAKKINVVEEDVVTSDLGEGEQIIEDASDNEENENLENDAFVKAKKKIIAKPTTASTKTKKEVRKEISVKGKGKKLKK